VLWLFLGRAVGRRRHVLALHRARAAVGVRDDRAVLSAEHDFAVPDLHLRVLARSVPLSQPLLSGQPDLPVADLLAGSPGAVSRRADLAQAAERRDPGLDNL